MTALQLKLLTNDAVIRVTMAGANPRQACRRPASGYVFGSQRATCRVTFYSAPRGMLWAKTRVQTLDGDVPPLGPSACFYF